VRVVPNLYPAFERQEVVIHTPRHARTVSELSADELAEVAEAWRRRREGAVLPKVFYVNWFRKDEDGKFLWPGFGENSRVLEWVFRRCQGEGEATETAIGLVPPAGDLNTEGLDLSAEALEELLTVDDDRVPRSDRPDQALPSAP